MSSTAIVSGEAYLALPRAPQTWLIEPLIPAGGAVMLYGDPKVGKSYAALQLALAMQSGTEWLGFPTRCNGPVVYVQLDTPRSLWADRLSHLQKEGYPIDTLHFADCETLDCHPFNILNPQHGELLVAALKGLPVPPIAVIIDTIREAHSGDEDKSTAMQPVIAALQAAVSPAALILIAHARKGGGERGPDLINDNRGSGYVAGRMDSIVRFSKKTIYYTGRAIEEGSLRLHRGDDGFWVPDQNELDAIFAAIINDPTYPSIRDKARALASRSGKSEEACRSYIRRGSVKGGSTT